MKKIILIITLMFVSLIVGNTSIFAGEEVITSERLENNSELKVFFNRLLSEKIFRADSITVAKGIEIIGIYQNKNRANIYCYIDTVVKKNKVRRKQYFTVLAVRFNSGKWYLPEQRRFIEK